MQQEIKNDINKQVEEIDALYTEKIKEAKEKVDRQAEKILTKAQKKAEKEVERGRI